MNTTNFILIILAAYLSLLSITFAVFDMSRYFILGLSVLVLLLVFALVVLLKIYDRKENAYACSTIFFSLLLLSSVFLYFASDSEFSIFVIMILSALFGLTLSIKKVSASRCVNTCYSSNPMVKDIPKIMTDVYNIIEKTKKHDSSDADKEMKEAKVESSAVGRKLKPVKSYSPGKFVASVAGTKYHSPKCDWAKKINKKNLVWLKSKADASKQGYKPCNCLK